MNSNFSTTQSTNLVALVGVIVMVLNYYKINIAAEEVTNLLGAGITLVGIVMNWAHRYKRGDLTALGKRR